jgi:rhodanese-related sulfurtransferase
MEKTSAFKKITAGRLKKLMTENAGVLLLDTLPDDLHARRHIPGAKNACVYEVVFPDRIRELAPQLNQDIIVYGSSRHSRDSQAAAEKLRLCALFRAPRYAHGLRPGQHRGAHCCALKKGEKDEGHP